jgi:hypothetical protein
MAAIRCHGASIEEVYGSLNVPKLVGRVTGGGMRGHRTSGHDLVFQGAKGPSCARAEIRGP